MTNYSIIIIYICMLKTLGAYTIYCATNLFEWIRVTWITNIYHKVQSLITYDFTISNVIFPWRKNHVCSHVNIHCTLGAGTKVFVVWKEGVPITPGGPHFLWVLLPLAPSVTFLYCAGRSLKSQEQLFRVCSSGEKTEKLPSEIAGIQVPMQKLMAVERLAYINQLIMTRIRSFHTT